MIVAVGDKDAVQVPDNVVIHFNDPIPVFPVCMLINVNVSLDVIMTMSVELLMLRYISYSLQQYRH